MTDYELSLVGFLPDNTKFNQKSCDALNRKLDAVLDGLKPLSDEWHYMAKKFHDYVHDRKWNFIDEGRAQQVLDMLKTDSY